MIREAKKQYIDKLINDLIHTDTNSKRWHKVVNQIITPQGNEFSQIPFLEVGEEIIESDYDVADALNTFIAEQSTIDDSNTPPPEFHPPNYELLQNIIITNDDVKKAINIMKSNKAPGPDFISPRLYKEGAEQLIPSLRRLFNLSLAVRKFPESWKRSNVTPVHKKR